MTLPERSNLLEVLRHSAAGPTRYVWCGAHDTDDQVLSAGQLLADAMGVAQSTRQPAGARVALMHPPGLDYLRAFYGAVAANLVPVPMYPPDRAALKHTLPRIDAILEAADASEIWANPAIADQLATARADSRLAHTPVHITTGCEPADDHRRAGPDPDAVAFLQFTSGSTRTPRGVRVTHHNVLQNSRAIQDAFIRAEGTFGVTWLPPYHDMGLIGTVIQPIYSGSSAAMMAPQLFARRPRRWLELISRFQATLSPAPNFGYALCVRRLADSDLSDLDLSAWELALCGAEPIAAQVLRDFARTFAPAGFRAEALSPCYGLAEATLAVTGHRPETPAGLHTGRFDSDALAQGRAIPDPNGLEIVACGQALLDTHVTIHADGQVLGDRHVGEIVVRSGGVAGGYHQAPEATRSTFTADGLRTGDLGFMDQGWLYVVGRVKEMLIVRGRNYAAHDLEAAVESHVDGLRPGRVVAGMLGDQPCVIAERGRTSLPDADLVGAMQQAVRTRFSIAVDAAIVPKGTVLVTSSGKRERLRTLAQLREGHVVPTHASVGLGEPAPSSPAHGILAMMVGELAPMLRLTPEQLDIHASLTELGLDSLAAAELQAEVAQHWGIEVSMSFLASGASLQDLADAVAQARADGNGHIRAAAPATEPKAGRHGVLARPSLFFFESQHGPANRGPTYAGLERAVRRADEAGFEAVWLPERHFHEFGAPFPNPAVLAAALSVQTTEIHLRAGSVVLPLHSPVRVVEEWAMVDRLSFGRVGLSFTSGWNPRDFVLAPRAFADRRTTLEQHIATVQRLWRGETAPFEDGCGDVAEVRTFPRPVQSSLPVWLTCTAGPERFEQAGREGYNVLTALLFQDWDTLRRHIERYRAARMRAGHSRGHVTLAVHNVCRDPRRSCPSGRGGAVAGVPRGVGEAVAATRGATGHIVRRRTATRACLRHRALLAKRPNRRAQRGRRSRSWPL